MMEARVGIEPTHKGFADLSLTTWVPRLTGSAFSRTPGWNQEECIADKGVIGAGGICIATCAYSEMNGLLRDLPGVHNPDQLVALHSPVSYPAYRQYRELNDVFSGTFAYVAPVPFGVSAGGRTERTWGQLVTP